MNIYIKDFGKIFTKGVTFGLGFLSILLLAGISYAAFTNFTSLQATTGETLTATKWNDMVDAVQDEYLTNGTEVITNKTWDGKPVYRKIVSTTVNNWSVWSKRIDTTSLNIDTAIEMEFRLGSISYESTDTISAPWVRAAGFQPDGVYGVISSSFNGQIFQAIIEYTKTTD